LNFPKLKKAKAHEVLAKQSFTHGKKFRGKSSDLDQIEGKGKENGNKTQD